MSHVHSHLARRLSDEVLAPLKRAFVGKDEIIDLMGVCLAAHENLFLLGPPGTAKSALVRELARRIDGRVFDYLLTRFTEPNELFGPFDIRRLRDGELVTNTEGMLPEADFVFLDELLNANSAILNSLLMALNERIFRRGRETRQLPAVMFVGASNRLPEDESLGALFDRFLLRVRCDNVEDDRLAEVLAAGWQLDTASSPAPASAVSVVEIRGLHRCLAQVCFAEIRTQYVETIRRLRRAGIPVSDRRAVKLQRLVGASALLCGRLKANTSDLWVLRYIWDTEEQQEIIASIVQEALEKATEDERAASHPRSSGGAAPDAEELALALDGLSAAFSQDELSDGQRAELRDRLALLAARCQWVDSQEQRRFLEEKVDALWPVAERQP